MIAANEHLKRFDLFQSGALAEYQSTGAFAVTASTAATAFDYFLSVELTEELSTEPFAVTAATVFDWFVSVNSAEEQPTDAFVVTASTAFDGFLSVEWNEKQ